MPVYIIYESGSKENLKNEKHFETLLCAAVGTASHRHGLEAYSVFGWSDICVEKWQSCTDRIWTKLADKNRGFHVTHLCV